MPADPTEGDGVMTLGVEENTCVVDRSRLTIGGIGSGGDPPSSNDPLFVPQLPIGTVNIETIDAGATLLYYDDFRAPLTINTLNGNLLVRGRVQTVFDPSDPGPLAPAAITLGEVNAGAIAEFGIDATSCPFAGGLFLQTGIHELPVFSV